MHTILLELRVDSRGYHEAPPARVTEVLPRQIAGLTLYDEQRGDAVLGTVVTARVVGSLADVAEQVAEAREHHDRADERLAESREKWDLVLSGRSGVVPGMTQLERQSFDQLRQAVAAHQQALDEALSALANLRAHHQALANQRGGGS